MKKLKFPTAQTILLIIAAFVAIMTWIIPSGTYDKLTYDKAANTFIVATEGDTQSISADQATLDRLNVTIPLEKFTTGAIYKAINIPGTYKKVESQQQGLGAFIQSPIKGIVDSSGIIFLVLIIGGLIGIMNLTGAFDAGIIRLSEALAGREYWLIIIVTTLVALGGTTFGFAEETIAFIPILVPVFIAAKYDALVGVACIFLGSSMGTMCSTINPFSTIIASDAAGIDWTTGLSGRIFMLVIVLIICFIYMIRYANRIKKDPSKSLVYEQRLAINKILGLNSQNSKVELTSRRKLVLLVFAISFVVMITGVSVYGWGYHKMTSTFLVGAILIGIIAKIKEFDFVEAFANGAGSLLGVAFIIGIARGITILMTDGLISDTILYHASTITTGMNKGIFTNSMLFTYGGLSFFIPSSSGMAMLTMPIMAPLGDTANVGREIVVNTYQYGMGLFYLINPTGLILASLAVVKIGFDKWLKFVLPLFIILILATMVVLTISVYI